MHARLIDGLSNATPPGAGSRRLRVVSRATILPYNAANVTPDSLRRALDVGTLLAGTIESKADTVRVTVRLTDTETGDQIGTSVAEALVAAQLNAYPNPLRPRLEPRLHAMVAAVLARSQLRDSALIVLKAAQKKDDSTVGLMKASAGVYALVNLPDSAFASARRLILKYPALQRGLERAAELRRLRSDARFAQIIAN